MSTPAPLRLDGSRHSGSGTLVRQAVALAALVGRPLHLYNVRARRQPPGLRPQHLKAVEAVAELVDARLEGAEVGSRRLTFVPRRRPRGGTYQWDIGTAGSATVGTRGVGRPSGRRRTGARRTWRPPRPLAWPRPRSSPPVWHARPLRALIRAGRLPALSYAVAVNRGNADLPA